MNTQTFSEQNEERQWTGATRQITEVSKEVVLTERSFIYIRYINKDRTIRSGLNYARSEYTRHKHRVLMSKYKQMNSWGKNGKKSMSEYVEKEQDLWPSKMTKNVWKQLVDSKRVSENDVRKLNIIVNYKNTRGKELRIDCKNYFYNK